MVDDIWAPSLASPTFILLPEFESPTIFAQRKRIKKIIGAIRTTHAQTTCSDGWTFYF